MGSGTTSTKAMMRAKPAKQEAVLSVPPETSDDCFPETSQTMMQAIQGGQADADIALNQFAQAYCEPLERYILRYGVPDDDARDMVHSFFLDVILKRRAIQELEPGTWRLRNFLRLAIGRYLLADQKKQHRQKRGGHLRQTSFESLKREAEADAGPTILQFEKDWAETILSRVYARLRSKYRVPGRDALYDALEPRIPSRSSLAGIAAQFELTDDAVKALIFRIRRDYRSFLYREVSQTVLDPADVETEMRYLLRALEYDGRQ